MKKFSLKLYYNFLTLLQCKLWSEADTLIKEGYVNWEAFLCQLNLEHLVKEQTS